MTQLYLIRHGEYNDLEDGKLIDRGLSDKGREQVELLRDRLAATREIAAEVLISSTMLRAQQTAAIIAPTLGLSVIHDDEMQEWRNTDGNITPEEFDAILQAPPLDQRIFRQFVPDGETWVQFMFRACHALNRLTQEHAGKTIVIVAHGGIIQAAFTLFCEFSTMRIPPIAVDPTYTSITHWRKIAGKTGDKWLLESYNDTFHLRPQA